jgi:DNA-binding LacI/PurR family transcriptional regulator
MTAAEAAGERRRRDGMTVAGIARLAGVSAPTVSRVLNGRSGVGLSTRRRVEQILREQGYRRPGAGEPAPVLELLFHALEGIWVLEILRGVEQVAQEHDLAVVVTEMRGRLTPGRAWTEQVLTRRPTGVVAVFAELTAEQQVQLSSRAIPLVLLDPLGEPMPETPCVGATNWTGGLAAARHLLELGHRRIAALAGPTGWLCCRARLDGYRAAMEQAGVPVDPELVLESSLLEEAGLRDGRRLLRLPDPPTAVVTAGDMQAMGVYEAAREAGVRIPADLSVVGFDDLPFTKWTWPPLTSVRRPFEQMGAAAAELALAVAEGRPLAPTRAELATTLVVRQSTAPPRS